MAVVAAVVSCRVAWRWWPHPSGIEVLGADRSCDTHVRGVSGDQVNATYMPKSAITISDDGSFVRNRTFSGLSTGHSSNPKTPQKEMKKEGEPTYLRTRWTMSWSCRYFMLDNIELGGEKVAIVSFQSRMRDGRGRKRTEARRRHLAPRNVRAG
jgi:hypothetical protein